MPDLKTEWQTTWPDYSPVEYTSGSVLSHPVWADPADCASITKFNDLDGKIDRRSHVGHYEIDLNGRPLNPMGRTGITGRGKLGKWGLQINNIITFRCTSYQYYLITFKALTMRQTQ